MAAVEQTPLSNNPFAPEEEDVPAEEPMETSEPMDDNPNKEQGQPTIKAVGTRIQEVSQWTNDELVRLLEVCEQPRTWEARTQILIEEFGKNHSDEFFTTEACMEKFKRLTGESDNRPANKDLLSWIKQFLKRSFNERHAHGEAARLARVRRFYELTMHALNDRLTEDQISELVGIDLYNDFVTNKLTEPNREGREEWLHADLFSSKLSHEEWKNAKNPEDLINKLRTQPINKSRLRFQHHPYKLKLLEDMDTEKDEPHVQADKQKPEDIFNQGVRSPAGRRSEALASVDSADHQSIDSAGKSPQRKKRRKLEELDKTPQQTIQIKREMSPEIVFYEPNITVVSSPTRILPPTPAPFVISVEGVESADPAKRQLRQRKPSDATSPETPAEIVTKVEIKREPSVQETETAQPMEVDENQPIVRPETSDSCTQTLLSIRLPVVQKQKTPEPKASEASTLSRASRRSSKKATDSGTTAPSTRSQTPANPSPTNQPVANLSRPTTIECRHVEVQTDIQNSSDLHGHVFVFTDQPVSDKLLIKIESEFHAEKKPKKEATETKQDKSKAGTPSAATRKRRNASATETKAETPIKIEGSALNTSPKHSPKEFVALITDEQTMSEFYPEIRLPEPEESAAEEQSTKKSKEPKEKSAPARRSRRSAAASHDETPAQETWTPAKKSANRPLQITTLQPSPSIAQEPKPGPVAPDKKTLLLSAHNLVIGHPKATEFRERVTDDLVAGYSDVVKFPMDLNTIKQLIDENKIKTLVELHDHYLLMCMNAILFNDDDHAVNQDARELKLFCAQTIQNLRHPTSRKAAAQRQSARRLTIGRGSGPSTSSGSKPFMQQSGADPRAQQFIRRTFVHSPNYHRVRKIKAPPGE